MMSSVTKRVSLIGSKPRCSRESNPKEEVGASVSLVAYSYGTLSRLLASKSARSSLPHVRDVQLLRICAGTSSVRDGRHHVAWPFCGRF